MLYLVISTDQKKRKKAIATLLNAGADVERVFVDDSTMRLADLRAFVYPSLFSVTTPIIFGLFLLDEHTGELDPVLLSELVQSPTIFILEEYAIAAARLKELSKAGAQMLLAEGKAATQKKVSPLFNAVTVLCTSLDKKEKWLTLQKTLATENAEALVGMLYWKLRDLMKKDARKRTQYTALYKKLIATHARAWIENIPLGLLLEKVILEK